MDRTTIMLPQSLKKRILKRANTMHVSLGEFLRLAAEDYLTRSTSYRQDDPLVTGDFIIRDQGPPDVSENMDKYLYGIKKGIRLV